MRHMGLEQFVRQHKMFFQARELIRCRGLWIQSEYSEQLQGNVYRYSRLQDVLTLQHPKVCMR